MSLFNMLGNLIQAPFKLMSGIGDALGGEQKMDRAQLPPQGPQDFQEWLKTTKYDVPVSEEYARKMANRGGGGIFYPDVPDFSGGKPSSGPGMAFRGPQRPPMMGTPDQGSQVQGMSMMPGQRDMNQLGGVLGLLARGGQNPISKGMGQSPGAAGNDEGSFFKRVAKIESNHNPRAISPTGAKGLYQFTRGTWKDIMGNQGDPFNPQDATVAMKKLTNRNRGILSKTLKREPKQFELYMAHNIGPGGAKALLTGNPNQRISRSLIGSKPQWNPKFLMGRSGPVTVGEALRRYAAAFGGR